MDEEQSVNPEVIDVSEPLSDSITSSIYQKLSVPREHYAETGAITEEDVDVVADAIVAYIKEIARLFGEDSCEVDEYEGDDNELIFDMVNGDYAVLIGHHGATLDALQFLLSSLISQQLTFHFPFVLDVNGYKSRRANHVKDIARSVAKKAETEHRQVHMSPMSAYERRLVHIALRDNPAVITFSEGEDVKRHVVVSPVDGSEINEDVAVEEVVTISDDGFSEGIVIDDSYSE